MVHLLYTDNQVNPFYHISYSTQLAINLGIAMYAIWNLDFFRSFCKPICLHPNLTYPQALLLDYAVGVYPLLLIFITLILVKLHDNYTFAVKIWRPFHRCLTIFRKQWNIQSSLINALATFIVLSYIKILNVSIELLIPTHVYDVNGNSVNLPYLYYNGSILMTSKAYRPYLVLALLMLLVFNILPLLLLALYPFACFQRFLNCWPCLRYNFSLQIFMDAFHGCYKDTPHDYRHFATLYLVLRLVNPLLYSMFNYKLYLPTASLLLTLSMALVAKFQPYKNKRSNTIDVVIMFALVCGYTSMLLSSNVCPMYPKWMNGIVASTSLTTPLSIMLFIALAKLFLKVFKYLKEIKRSLLERMNKVEVNSSLEEQMFSNCQGADYHTCMS